MKLKPRSGRRVPINERNANMLINTLGLGRESEYAGKQVVVDGAVYNSLAEASEVVGVSRPTLRKAIESDGICNGVKVEWFE